MEEKKKAISVVCALIEEQGKIFAAQRGYGAWKDWWEFPGGKIEPGETPREAIIREIREELAVTIEPTEDGRGWQMAGKGSALLAALPPRRRSTPCQPQETGRLGMKSVQEDHGG